MQWVEILEAAGAFALVLTAIAITYALVRASATMRRAESLLGKLEDDLPRLLDHGDATLGRVDEQLDQVGRVLRTTADGMERADRVVRRVGHVVETPVGKIAGASAYARGAVSGLVHRRREPGDDEPAGLVADVRSADADGRRAAAEIARELADELGDVRRP